MSQLNTKKVKFGDNVDLSKNFVLSVPAVADGTFSLKREDGTVVWQIPTPGGAITLNNSLAFSGAAQRILGDFGNATQSQRLLFQSNVVNGSTAVGAIPNGTSQVASFAAYGGANPDNASYLNMGVSSVSAYIDSGKNGTGAFLPLMLITSNKQRFEVSTNGICRFRAADTQGGRAHFNRIDDADFAGLIDVSTNNEFRVYQVGNAGEAMNVGTSSAGGGPLKLLTNGQERMHINAAGNVGIGAVPPGSLSDASRFMVIGDSDSGIGSPGDGRIGIYTDGRKTAEFTFEVLAIKGYNEGGELQLWNANNSKFAIVDYYNPASSLRILNGGEGIRIFEGGNLDTIRMNAGTVTPYAAADIRLNPPGHTHYTQLISEHFPGNWVGGAISIPPAAKDWSFRNDGNAYAHNGSWVAQSDIRSKRNLSPIVNALAKLDAINGYFYERNDLPEVDETGIHFDPRRVGIVAQELQGVLPAGVFKISEESLGIDPMAVIGFLVQVCKELKAEVMALKGA